MKKFLIVSAILFAGCNQSIEQKPQIFRLYNNTKWYYPDSKSTVTIPAGYYAIEGDSIVCIKKDSVTILVQVEDNKGTIKGQQSSIIIENGNGNSIEVNQSK